MVRLLVPASCSTQTQSFGVFCHLHFVGHCAVFSILWFSFMKEAELYQAIPSGCIFSRRSFWITRRWPLLCWSKFGVSSSFSACYDLSTFLACAQCPTTRDFFIFNRCCYNTSVPNHSHVANNCLLLVFADMFWQL